MAIHNPKWNVDPKARTFHSDSRSPYTLPNDEAEQKRLDTQSRFFERLMGGDILHAPVDRAAACRAVDIGCGTGHTTTTLARLLPSAEVYGLDISEVPRVRLMPPNVCFLQGNFMSQLPVDWTSDDGGTKIWQSQNAFDLTFSRLLVQAVNDWPGFIRREMELLKPGGWCESHELDASIFDGNQEVISDNWEWHRLIGRLRADLGLDPLCGSRMKERMIEAGFVDVAVKKYRWPLGGDYERDANMKVLGDFWLSNIRDVYELVLRRAAANGRVSEDELHRLIVEKNLTLMPEPGKHQVVYVTYGRKPEAVS